MRRRTVRVGNWNFQHLKKCCRGIVGKDKKGTGDFGLEVLVRTQ